MKTKDAKREWNSGCGDHRLPEPKFETKKLQMRISGER